MKKHVIVLVSVSLVVLAILTIAGCKKAPEQPKEKVLIVAASADISTLDNGKSVGPPKNYIIQMTDWQWWGHPKVVGAGGALTVDFSDPRKIEPRLITKIDEQVLPDGRCKYTLYMRKGATFHSGNPITVNDLIFAAQRRASFKRNAIELTQVFWDVQKPGSYKIIDDYTLEMYADRPSYGGMFYFMGPQRNLVDSKLVKEKAGPDDPWGEKFLERSTETGSGPYKITSWTPGVEVVYEKFKNWWGTQIGEIQNFDKMIFRIVPDASQRALMLKKGDVDIALDLPANEIKGLQGAPGVKLESFPSTEKQMVCLNYNMAPFKDNVKLRQAMNYAFPYGEVINTVYLGLARRLPGPIPTDVVGALSQPAYTTDLDKAKALLAEAGYANKGLNLTLTINTGFPSDEDTAVLFKASLAKIGVNLTIEKMPNATFQTAVLNRTLTMHIRNALWWVPMQAYIFNQTYRGGVSTNETGYKNDQVDALLIKAETEPDATKRAAMYAEVQRLIVADAPAIWYASPNFTVPMRTNIVGYRLEPSELHHLWLLDKVEVKK